MLCSAVQVNAQWGMKGEGELVKQELDIDDFTGVKLSFHGNIYLTQGATQKVVVEAQQNIIDNLKRDVKGNTWNVGFKKSVRNCKPVKVWITIPHLTEATVSGSGNLVTEAEFTGVKDLKTSVSGSGDIKLHVQAETIHGGISGSGEIRLKGSTGRIDMSISGSGDIEAMDLKAHSCNISISGSGDAEFWVTEELEASVSGSGDIKYKGDAAQVRARVSGSGDVTQVN
jgi:hypothetical protein